MEKPFSRPETPGYQLLLDDIARYTTGDPDQSTATLLSAHIMCRKWERFPDEHFDHVMQAVFNLCMLSMERGEDIKFSHHMMEFFDAQLGREGFTDLAAKWAPDWEVVDDPDMQVGYTLHTKDMDKVRAFMRTQERRRQIQQMFGGFGMPGISLVEMRSAASEVEEDPNLADPAGGTKPAETDKQEVAAV